MSRSIRIFGASDDLIEIRGDLGDDEGYGPGFVELSTGDVFEAVYADRGVWDIRHHVDSGKCEVSIFVKAEEDDEGYTGHADVDGPIAWFEFWDEWPPSDTEVRERLVSRAEDVSGDTLRVAYHAVTGRGLP